MKKFTPKPGQVDFTNVRFAPVVNSVVVYKDRILLVLRSKELNFYPEYWNGISGFLDDKKTLEEKVQEELREELGISKNAIEAIHMGDIFHQEEPKYEKTWIVHPTFVRIQTDQIKIDWEAEKYRFVLFEEALTMKLLPGFREVLERVRQWF